ncbi:hypothetical protein cypCar_00030014 [Cyprinus carpio]|nr:hypothetical protein cypCar_00030014 [Cyprinus carpio]
MNYHFNTVQCRWNTVARACSWLFDNITEHYERLSGSASEDGYLTAILLRKDRVQFLQSNMKYPTTEMGEEARGLPYGISEVWEMLGELEKSKYTWDTSINVNKEIPHSIRLRFDRLFLRAAAEGAQLWPESMTLIGLEKLKCDYSSAITSLRHQKSSVSMIDFNCYGLHMIIQLNESQCFINKSLLINEI